MIKNGSGNGFRTRLTQGLGICKSLSSLKAKNQTSAKQSLMLVRQIFTIYVMLTWYQAHPFFPYCKRRKARPGNEANVTPYHFGTKWRLWHLASVWKHGKDVYFLPVVTCKWLQTQPCETLKFRVLVGVAGCVLLILNRLHTQHSVCKTIASH